MIETLFRFADPAAASRPPLRVGILLNGFSLPPAYAALVEQLKTAGYVELVLAIHCRVPPSAQPSESSLAYRLYRRWDQRTQQAANPESPWVDCSPLLQPVPRLEVEMLPAAPGGALTFPPQAEAAVRDAQLDVLVDCADQRLAGGILTAARHGIWFHHYGDSEFYRGGPAYFWEMVEANPLTGVTLQVRGEGLDDGFVLSKAACPCESRTSQARNAAAPYAMARTMMIRKLRDLHAHGFEHLQAHAPPPTAYRGRKPSYGPPSNWRMLQFAIPTAQRLAGQLWTGQRRGVYHWRIGLRPAKPFPAAGANSCADVRWIEAPPGRMFADPFGFEHDGQKWLLFEDYCYQAGRARLSAARLDDEGRLGGLEVMLDRPYHMSYPFLWREGGELYMIPESYEDRSVQLFRCRKFPGEWEFVRTMFTGPAVDTTILRHDGRLWFFLSLVEKPASEQLFLFSAPSLLDDWTHHPASPISLDIRHARCGGAFIEENGRTLRVAQDGSQRYGYALRFREVVRLNEREYEERDFGWLTPPDGLAGVHTYNRLGNWEIFDGQRLERLEDVRG
jgi:hypothetical protein